MKEIFRQKGKSFFSLLLAGVFILSQGTVVRAFGFKDVSNDHWAAKNIESVAELGLMIGDFEGYFKPDDYIDKFDASILIARIVGYDANGSTEVLNEYDRIYSKWSQVIANNSADFSRWKHNADKYIAYLLEHNILIESDLYQFVVLMDGKERLRALSREEMAIMLVRALGKETAIYEVEGKKFNDDEAIDVFAKPYVYYLQATGIIAGDTNNNFNPNDAIQRSAVARVVDLAYEKIKKTDITDPGNGDNQSSNYQTITGEIAQLYTGMNAIQISSDMVKYHNSIKVLAPNITVKIDDVQATVLDIKAGMVFSGVIDVNKDEIVSLNISTTGKKVDPIDDPDQKEEKEEVPKTLYTLEGTVEKTETERDHQYIDIEIRMLNAHGDVVTSVRNFRIAKGAEIYRGNTLIAFAKIENKEAIAVEYNDNVVYKIQLEEEKGEVSGKILEKKTDGSKNLLKIEAEKTGNIKEYRLTKDSTITRNNRRQGTFADLKIGDEVDVYTLYGDIDHIEARGYKSTEDVVIESVYQGRDESYVIGIDDAGKTKKYYLSTLTSSDFTDLKVGAKIRFRLDSDEVESFIVLEAMNTNTYTGSIYRISRNTLELEETGSSYIREFSFDDDTTVVDAVTGKNVSINYLSRDMKVYIVTSTTNAKYARVITILSN